MESDPRKSTVAELRQDFLNKMTLSECGLFHDSDIIRVQTDDNYLSRFLTHNDGDIDAALKMLWETCIWRMSFGVNDMNENNLNQTILKSGCVFPHGKDIDGKSLLIFKSKKHFKGEHDFEDHKKCLVYWLERLEREGNGEMISLFFDMHEAGLGNVDLDYTMYLINLFKCYYPNFLNYIIVFEAAWVLNAMFKVIKSWLPPKAIAKLKFVDKVTVTNFVDSESRLVSWGGKDKYVFSFTPYEEIPAKKVHFAESLKEEQPNESGFEEPTTPTITLRLNVFPPDIMVFSQDHRGDIFSSFVVRNEDSQCISYKIKTTSPLKFRVRPSFGVLNPGMAMVISVSLLPGLDMQSLEKDKFLIMAMPVDKDTFSKEELTCLWKSTNNKEIHQFKLMCYLPKSLPNPRDPPPRQSCEFENQQVLINVSSDVALLNNSTRVIEEEMKFMGRQQRFILCSIILLLLLSLWQILFGPGVPESSSQNCWTEGRGK